MTDETSDSKPTKAEATGPKEPVLFQLPPGVARDDLQAFLEQKLGQALPPDEARLQAKRAFSARITLTSTQQTFHQGPLPPAEMAEAFERSSPGSINRMFDMAEKDQDAFIDSRKDIIRRDDRFRVLALGGGIVGLLIICAAVIWLALQNHDGVAAALATIGIAGVIGAIVNARLSSSKERTGIDLDDDPDGDRDDVPRA